MNERDWLGCTDPRPMLQLLRDKASARKLRLFAVACCRRVSEMASFGEITVAERAADGLATEVELAEARAEAERGFQLAAGQFSYVPAPQYLHADAAAMEVTWSSAWEAAESTSVEITALVGEGERPAQAALLRDIFGNPFRPAPTKAPGWLHWKDGVVRKLAEAVYEERAFHCLPILADALEEAGCTDSALIAHYRQPSEHVRGCWAVDLVLGKE
jgi:hypothetical protein